MIKWTGERVIELARVVLPGDIRQRALQPHVADIAARLQANTQVELPVVRRAGKWRLLSGADIVAAHIRLGWAQMNVRTCKCTELEAKLFTLECETRDAHSAETKEALFREIAALKEQILRDPPAELKGGRRTPLRKAVAEVAKATRRNETSLLRLYRQHLAGTPTEELDPLPVKDIIFDCGLPVPPELIERCAQVQMRLVGIKDGLSRTLRQLRLAREQKLPIANVAWEREFGEMYRLATQCYPRSVCPYCKLVPGVQENCAACAGNGWIGEGAMAEVPDKFWDKADRIVMTTEGIKRYAELLPLGPQETKAS